MFAGMRYIARVSQRQLILVIGYGQSSEFLQCFHAVSWVIGRASGVWLLVVLKPKRCLPEHSEGREPVRQLANSGAHGK